MAIDFSNLSLSTPTSIENEENTPSSGIDFSKLTLGQPKRTVGGTLKDVAVTAGKGLIGLAESGVGLADLASGGKAGKALEDAGYNLKADQEFLSNQYSPAQKVANQKVEAEDSFGGKIGAMLQNPSTIATSIGESLPSMVAGGAV